MGVLLGYDMKRKEKDFFFFMGGGIGGRGV